MKCTMHQTQLYNPYLHGKSVGARGLLKVEPHLFCRKYPVGLHRAGSHSVLCSNKSKYVCILIIINWKLEIGLFKCKHRLHLLIIFNMIGKSQSILPHSTEVGL